jgi:hypothetical protein
MVVRVAEAEWQGDLTSGQGRIKLGSGAFAGSYSYPSRFESAEGTNPEELLGAAEAGCFFDGAFFGPDEDRPSSQIDSHDSKSAPREICGRICNQSNRA